MKEANEYLFVYGTLLKIADHMMSNYLERSATFQGRGYIHGRMYEIMRYPGAVSSPSPDEKVRGEIYLLKDAEAALRDLDHYEECVKGFPEPFEFRREKVLTYIDGKEEPVMSWVYLYNLPTDHLMQIKSGDYEQFLKERR